MQVKEIMTKEVITINEKTPVSELAELMFDRGLTGMPVVDKDRHVVGIVTEYDLLSREEHIHVPSYMRLLAEFNVVGDKKHKVRKEIETVLSLKAQDIMTKPVVTISPETQVAEAARIFADEHINPLPVVDVNGVLTGIVSRADIVKLFKSIEI